MQTTTERVNETIDSLNSLLRGEMSAVETYRQALEKIKDTSLRMSLTECLDSHQSRVEMLRSRIVQLGGKPSEGSGAWGAFAKLIQGGAKVFGDKAAIAALEEGEDHGLKDYRDEIPKLDAETRGFVETQLLAAQERTHRTISAMKKTLH
jgi:uncharacterized protein (TIGR02284 family)